MKQTILSVLVTLATFYAFGQTPDLISYQAVIRDVNNTLVTSQNVSVQVSILETSASGSAVYVETHNVTTNANGLATLKIGGGNVVSGVFGSVEWGEDDHFLKVETDPDGGTNYTITGTSQLLSVPYALSARTVEELPEPIYNDFGSLNNASYNLTSSYSAVGPVLNVTKESDDSVLEVFFNGRVRSGTFSGASGVFLEIRVDGSEADFANRGSIRSTNTDEFQSIFAVFEGLSAGSHQVQFYAKTNSGTSTGFFVDPGGWGARLITKETY